MNKKLKYKVYDTKICQCLFMNPYSREYKKHMDKYHSFTGDINNDIDLSNKQIREEIT